MLDQSLIDLIVCPDDKQPLDYLETEAVLYNSRLHRIYNVRDNIPVLLIDDARAVDDAEHERLSQLIESGAAKRTGGTR